MYPKSRGRRLSWEGSAPTHDPSHAPVSHHRLEDLNGKGMVGNRNLSRAVSDRGFFAFRRPLDYKAAQRGGMIVVADRWYPSSKTCSARGHKRETLPLSVREWTCPECGSIHDRDMNAAIHLKNLAVSSTVSACGEEGSGFGC